MVDKSHVIFHCMNAYGPKESRKHTRTDCLSQPFERRLVQKQLPEGKMCSVLDTCPLKVGLMVRAIVASDSHVKDLAIDRD